MLTWRCEQRKSADVDGPVENHVDSLNGDIGVDDHSFAFFGDTDLHGPASVLFGDQRGNIGLDATRAQTGEQDGGDEATKTGATGKRAGDRGAHQDQQACHVDAGKGEDGLVLAEILIGNDTAQ